jgi:hypothetical protein
MLNNHPYNRPPEGRSLSPTSGRASPDNLRPISYPRNAINSSRNRIQSINMYSYDTKSIIMRLQQVDRAFGGVVGL